ncbi:hypothetical protein ACJOV8_017395 [Formosa sp. 3Alg 14/1]
MSESVHYETVLTDKNNKIIALFNPLFSEGIKELYIKEIKKRLN